MTDYVFQDTTHQAELSRLRSIEEIFDPATRRRLLAAGLRNDSRCLELGPGAGSIMRWMAAEASSVTAVDLNTRFLTDPPANVRVLSGDIRSVPLEPSSFDVVHARYVLIHIPDFQPVLQALWSALKPGGALVLEEPDFTRHAALAGTEKGMTAFTRVHRAINAMYVAKGIDPALGAKLPGFLKELGARDLSAEVDAPASPGGSGIARMMSASSAPLADRYAATGEAGPQDVPAYAAFAEDPLSQAVYYATVSTLARK
jgi:2-polyprenyl-3-methyl-5-hydroxy-6-metoxy-1,4-benzoquinol methylase